ncbi:MAG TPA: NADH-quinone oxidoreductase subunit NuoH [Bacteroidetes bacterium]|nr:NADH-quinone oxidoreductase subunit NuoH [Bacteroidota bacterium]
MTLGISLIIIGISLGVLLTAAAYSVYAERKLSAFIQQRPGPNRVGPMGLLQPLADVIKLLLKEDIIPAQGDKLIHFLSPVVSVTIALTAFAVIPFGFNGEHPIMVANVNMGVLYILALTSISVYGITLAGWSSNSKYALLGGLRASASMISYELSMGLSVVSVVLLTNFTANDPGVGYLSLTTIVDAQAATGIWNMFLNPVGFLIFVTCTFAETNRTPFDLVEAEQELVGGFHTEYSSMKFATFFVAEYLGVIIASMFITTLFMGGYHGPLENTLGVAEWGDLAVTFWSLGWFIFKTVAWVLVFIWVRWTLPRFKYDQLMSIGWKSFLPVSIINLMLVAIIGFIVWRMTM